MTCGREFGQPSGQPLCLVCPRWEAPHTRPTQALFTPHPSLPHRWQLRRWPPTCRSTRWESGLGCRRLRGATARMLMRWSRWGLALAWHGCAFWQRNVLEKGTKAPTSLPPSPPPPSTRTMQVFEYIMQSLANYRSMHMRMQQLAAEGALDGGEVDVAAHDRAAAGALRLLHILRRRSPVTCMRCMLPACCRVPSHTSQPTVPPAPAPHQPPHQPCRDARCGGGQHCGGHERPGRLHRQAQRHPAGRPDARGCVPAAWAMPGLFRRLLPCVSVCGM